MKLTADQALKLGITAHKEGKLRDAERIYRRILQSRPKHPGANHNLGILLVSHNKLDAGLPLLKTALQAEPKAEQFWLSYITTLIKNEQFNLANKVISQAREYGFPQDKLDLVEAQLTTETGNAKLTADSPLPQHVNSLLQHYRTEERKNSSIKDTQI